jgi:DNA-binding MarR family transcriptional regulator
VSPKAPLTRRAIVDDEPALGAAHPEVPLARLFAIAYRHLVAGLHMRLAARGWHDVRPSYGYVLLAARDRDTTSTELAALLGVSKQATSKLLDAMEEAGYIGRRPSPEDSRARPVSLTARGRRLLATVETIYAELEEEWSVAVGGPAVEQIRSSLVTVLEEAYDGQLPPVRPVL